jgi:hypothetical protein
MDRRELLGMLGAGAAGLVAAGGVAHAQQGQQAHQHDEHHEHHIQTIDECARVCNETAHHCLEQLRGGGQGQADHARIHDAAMDCQAFCHLTSALMARHSKMAPQAHAACAEACAACAKACEEASEKSDVVKRCAEACRACEKVCRQMTGTQGATRR